MPGIVKIDVFGEAAADYAGVFRGRPDEVSRGPGRAGALPGGLPGRR
ncbi:MAG TPA: hypothetical protein VFW50_21845 [Streptosporangiaceae bacterium]|nr:hypothetical protein [Streptosporangiaceae bacterium]